MIDITFHASSRAELEAQIRAYLGEEKLVREPSFNGLTEEIANDSKELIRAKVEQCLSMNPPLSAKGIKEVIWQEDGIDISLNSLGGLIAQYNARQRKKKAKEFVLAHTPVPGSLVVAKNGEPLVEGYDYTQKGSTVIIHSAADAKILSMLRAGNRDPLMISDVLNRELGGSWTQEKVRARMKELKE